MTQAKTLALDTLEHLTRTLRLTEVHGRDGGAFMPLVSAMPGGGPVGELRILGGDAIGKLVYVGLGVPQLGLDSHMLFAFGKAGSALPHFTVDSVWTGEYFAFHCDLVPRVDLGANLAYIDAALAPLTERFLLTQKLSGLSPAQLTPRQTAFMSPWMLAYRANPEAFAAIAPIVRGYADHWLGLVERGLDGFATAPALAARDQLNRAALFNPDVDPVWGRVDRLIGAEAGARMREILRGQSLERAL
jgi:hypothetical protein